MSAEREYHIQEMNIQQCLLHSEKEKNMLEKKEIINNYDKLSSERDIIIFNLEQQIMESDIITDENLKILVEKTSCADRLELGTSRDAKKEENEALTNKVENLTKQLEYTKNILNKKLTVEISLLKTEVITINAVAKQKNDTLQ